MFHVTQFDAARPTASYITTDEKTVYKVTPTRRAGWLGRDTETSSKRLTLEKTPTERKPPPGRRLEFVLYRHRKFRNAQHTG